MKNSEIVSAILIMTSTGLAIGLMVGLSLGWHRGATSIACGAYKASLAENPDKTTYWKFEESK